MTQLQWIGTTDHLAALGLTGISIGAPGNAISYASQEAAESDLADGSIPAEIIWLMYDPEYQATTPSVEQASAQLFGKYFGQAAHVRGYRTIWAPARDLVYPSTGSYANTDAWYLANMPIGASWNDVYLIQSEHDVPDLAAYTALVKSAVVTAQSANPYVACYAELATTLGTKDAMIAAGQSVLGYVSGFYLSIPDGDVQTMHDVVDGLLAS